MFIESVRDRILADEDWKMKSIIMDLAPSADQELKKLMGKQWGYFVDISPEATDEEAEAAHDDSYPRRYLSNTSIFPARVTRKKPGGCLLPCRTSSSCVGNSNAPRIRSSPAITLRNPFQF